MTSQPLLLDHGIHTIPKRRPVVIQIHELPLSSPPREHFEQDIQRLVDVGVAGKIEDASWDACRQRVAGLNWKRPRSSGISGVARSSRLLSRRRRSSMSSVDEDAMESAVVPNQERPTMKLLPFPGRYGSESFTRECAMRRASTDGRPPTASATGRTDSLGPFASRSWPQSSHFPLSSLNGSCGIVPPLTPPEDLDSFQWEVPSEPESIPGIRSVSDIGSDRPQRQRQPRPSSASRPSEIQMPDRSQIGQDEPSRSNWLGRACQLLVSGLGDSANQHQIQMVVQALPSQAKSGEAQPVFEKVVEAVQGHFIHPPYITITHAVSQVISMDEVPASPPATPNTNYSSDDYFQDQTIFTHAAVVPPYHSQPTPHTNIGPRPTNIIAAPSSIQISILERYIPPTTAQEMTDFFTMSRRSYLADRLLELSSNNGTLLLIYPTKTGAATFAHKYIGPVIEPFLRQFILLNGLYVDIAMEMGRMAAVSGMKSFEQMEELLVALCQALSQRAPSRGLPSRYVVAHAESAEVVLDRALWKDWYVEQEQPRLRQNLVDYHKAGGRMPARVGQIEVTTGMLAREVVDGIRQSHEAAGNAGIEVGVFVIRRMAL